MEPPYVGLKKLIGARNRRAADTERGSDLLLEDDVDATRLSLSEGRNSFFVQRAAIAARSLIQSKKMKVSSQP